MRFLIAEDNGTDFEVLVRVLKKEVGEFDCQRTYTTKLARGLLETEKWDLVVYDPHLLDKANGKGLEDVIRLAHRKNIPVIVLTGDMLFAESDYPSVRAAESWWEKDDAFNRKRAAFGKTVRAVLGVA